MFKEKWSRGLAKSVSHLAWAGRRNPPASASQHCQAWVESCCVSVSAQTPPPARCSLGSVSKEALPPLSSNTALFSVPGWLSQVFLCSFHSVGSPDGGRALEDRSVSSQHLVPDTGEALL